MSAKTASRNVDIPFDTYLQLQYDFSLDAIQRAVSPAGAAKGAMQASPSRVHPDYFYHWVRDAGLTMSLVNQLYADATDQTQRDSWGTILADHADFSRRLQETDNPSHGLGEPKFNMNGSAFWENWGRPQNDGPAIRAYAIIEYGHLWAKQGGDWSRLYTSEWPATSVIKRDLEYTAHHWEEPSFDVWEEVSGQHFFNFMVSRRAMREGASLARQFDDTGASDYYAQQEDRIASRLDEFWDATKGYVTTTRNYHRGLGDKVSNLDTQVLLASLHASYDDGVYTPESERILATTEALIEKFSRLYAINTMNSNPSIGVAIGRYVEDVYDGYGYGEGNPWILATACVAEIHYRAVNKWLSSGQFEITSVNLPFLRRASQTLVNSLPLTMTADSDLRFRQIMKELKETGDTYMRRIHKMGRMDLNLYEQWGRESGQSRGAPHLTWSYAAFITAIRAREQLNL
ncbi:Six-hairpin glycosidase-like protein [Dimargaris cristalligena]|uniref:glucan 1,4-alpha-glucosidase n=1 Tax=Dimargaris cristalligena TaxID=215637 RepID=A0A4V1J5D8_9FUNG|nr:Six-hairpin glycosidase-like protein [Dimargaris cristalligena]|eukprot:RKP38709.1 Six-hairpin glycosidase-like protein [Dimargaris cristalligena]